MRRRRRQKLTDRQIDAVWADACEVLACPFECWPPPPFAYRDIVYAGGPTRTAVFNYLAKRHGFAAARYVRENSKAFVLH